MELIRYALIGVLGTITALALSGVKKEYGLLCGFVTGAILLSGILGTVTGLFDTIKAFLARYSLSSELMTMIVRVLGLSYLTETGAQLCRDGGQSALALKLELCGRALILCSALPAVVTLLETGSALIQGAAP